MKKLLFILSCIVGLQSWGQVDTLNPLTQKQIADSIFNSLNPFVSSGKLHNRLLFDDISYSLSLNTNTLFSETSEQSASVDDIYGLIYEIKNMSIDTSTMEDPLTVFRRVSQSVNEIEFTKRQIIYPLGILDFNFEYLDVTEQESIGNISINDQVISVKNEFVELATKNTRLVAPMYEFIDGNIIGLELRKENFFSNYRQFSDISTFKIILDSLEYTLQPDIPFFFKAKPDSIQILKIQLIYKNGDTIQHLIQVRTPEQGNGSNQAKSGSFPDCTSFTVGGNEYIDIAGNQISWCLLPRCGYDGRLLKPYFLLTGYRPPLLEQAFEKTYQYYNDEHDQLIEKLRANNYDVFLVRFNIHARPFDHGMEQSADLLIKFIEAVNAAKNTSYGHENVIQGSSMSADIANLALLKMEKKHLDDNSYPHHHSRLFIAYDANFYGGNLPLAYQYQIVSFVRNPQFNNFFSGVPVLGASITIYNILRYSLSLYLYATIEQKTVKELLQYHAFANSPSIFISPVSEHDFTPTHHPLRQNYYNALAAVDNEEYFFPMPWSTRNISVSLGKIKNTNSYDDERFISAGDSWIDINLLLWRFKLNSAKYTTSGNYHNLFIRRKTGVSFPLIWSSPFIQHKVNVTGMQEIDNAAGSYLPGSGNLIAVGNWTFFPLSAAINALQDEKHQFTHKSVLTAFAINPNLWPANGSSTLDMHNMGLMYNQFDIVNIPQSNNYGYPNLGRPTDHFEVTPFEAVYVDNLINPHIRYEDPVDAPDAIEVTNFMLNEIEPWYLGLQNTNLGSKARSNYVYHSYRRAKHQIVVGHLVTPTTDPGDYVTETNAVLILKAGDEINLKPGVHFKAGSTVHIVPEYDICNDEKNLVIQSNHHPTSAASGSSIASRINVQQLPTTDVVIFPNPVIENLTIRTTDRQEMTEISIYDLFGHQLFTQIVSASETTIALNFMEKGVYFVKIKLADQTILTKQLQKL